MTAKFYKDQEVEVLWQVSSNASMGTSREWCKAKVIKLPRAPNALDDGRKYLVQFRSKNGEYDVDGSRGLFDALYIRAHRFSTYPPLSSSARNAPSVAYVAACAAIRAQAFRTACCFIKERARDYLEEPWQLDMLGSRPGFMASRLTPDQLIEFGKELLRACEKMAPRRIEIVPVKKWNARAAILVGRYLRAKARMA